MSENNLFQEPAEVTSAAEKKPIHAASLVMGILSLSFSLLIALLGEIFGIIGIVLACKNKKEHRTTAALICSIVGLVVAAINHIWGIILSLAMLA